MVANQSALFQLSDDLHILFLSSWLDLRSFVTLDVAVSNHAQRIFWKNILPALQISAVDDWAHNYASFKWLIKRGLRASRVEIKFNAAMVSGLDISQLDTTKLLHLGLVDCCCLVDSCILAHAVNLQILESIDLRGCSLLTDASISLLGQGCPLLRNIAFGESHALSSGFVTIGNKIYTDIGLYAIGKGCPLLESVNLTGCAQVTDDGLSAIAYGCPHMQSIDLTGCRQISDAGAAAVSGACPDLKSISFAARIGYGGDITDETLLALASGCTQLQSIDMTCCEVTDEGAIALAAGCRELRSINFASTEVEDDGIIALAQASPHLLRINLSMCSVTDRCAPALAHGCPLLQNINIAHTSVTDVGVSALAQGCTQLLRITLAATSVTDVGVCAIAKGCPQLESILLQRCKVTNIGISALAHVPHVVSTVS